jgi:hypothetical protein
MNFTRLPRVSDFAGPVSISEGPSRIPAIRSALRTEGDGPLTPFVLISRAARIASDRRAFNAEDVANALYSELTERGWLVDDADAIEEMGT